MKKKKVYISECCVISNDDKGQRTMVGKAKEVLTSLSKNNIDVYIILESGDKEAVKKFLDENSVPFADIIAWSDMSDKKQYDALVLGDSNVVLLRDDWDWALDNLATVLYSGEDKKPHTSEQERTDNKFKDYRHWAEEAAKARKKRRDEGSSVG